MTIRRILVRLACLSCLALPAGFTFAAEPVPLAEAQTFPELRTEKGRIFTQVKVLAIEPDGLRLQHDAGVSKVPFAELPEPLRQKYPYDPLQAAAFAKAVETSNRQALEAMEKERLRVNKEEQKRKAGVAPEVDLDSEGPVTMDQVKARWLLANAARGLNYGDRNYTAREVEIADYKLAVQTGVYDREAEKAAMRHNFEWHLKEGRVEQAALAQKRLASLEEEDLRREHIASLERLAKSVDRAAHGASSAVISELSSIRLELEKLRREKE